MWVGVGEVGEVGGGWAGPTGQQLFFFSITFIVHNIVLSIIILYFVLSCPIKYYSF